MDDPVVERVRHARDLVAQDYGYDLRRYCLALMRRQAKSKAKYRAPTTGPRAIAPVREEERDSNEAAFSDGPIVAQVRAARTAISTKYGNDIHRYARAIARREAKSKLKFYTPKKRSASR